jgi:dipeptidyl aminopeptidase/acylaminoacyl peptidase
MAERLRCLAFLLALAVAAPAGAAEQSSANPVLRLETGLPLAAIKGAAVDAAGHMLVTGGDDKTLRLWSLDTGELIRVMRPPIDHGNEGKIYAAALSPDGKLAIAGGYLGVQMMGLFYSLYVFDTATGTVVRRISGMPQTTNTLAWSPDGRFVAAIMGDGHGVRVYRTADWSEAAKDADFADDAYGLAFDRSGRLAASGYDGFVRLYDADFKRIAKVRTPSSGRPGSIAFSPDGTRLALGYDTSTEVDVLSVPSLERVFAVDTKDITNGDLSQVAWATDGALLAGGLWTDGSERPVLRWTDGGRGARDSFATAGNTVMKLIPLADGGWVYATADPSFGRYDAHGKRILERRTAKPILLDQRGILRLSADGLTVGFGFDDYGGRRATFSVADRSLTEGPWPAELATADTAGMGITGWSNSREPKLGGVPIELDQQEAVEAMAEALDHQSFLLGGQWYLYRYDAQGHQKYQIDLEEVPWAVNISRDGKLAVTALNDGTIHWFRYSDGTELLALFPDRDGKRWVMWTPAGYLRHESGRRTADRLARRARHRPRGQVPAGQRVSRPLLSPWRDGGGAEDAATRRTALIASARLASAPGVA